MQYELEAHEECTVSDKCSKYEQCPMVLIQDIISGKWKILILWYLSYNTLRFSDIQRKIQNVTPKVLARQLRRLEEEHLVKRKVYPVIPPKVEYSLTDVGRKLIPLLEMMHHFGVEYLEEDLENSAKYL
jgi:DNA-binding HxlR family transcriptional regulator